MTIAAYILAVPLIVAAAVALLGAQTVINIVAVVGFVVAVLAGKLLLEMGR